MLRVWRSFDSIMVTMEILIRKDDFHIEPMLEITNSMNSNQALGF